ncbi:recombinase family protein, partial [Bacillaceae bacterium S4-13-58]
STLEQSLDLQLDALNHYGCEQIYQEKVTGSRSDRPQLQEMIDYLRKGDIVIVYKLDRISRSTKHLIQLSELFDEMGVQFVSLRDSIDTSTAMGRFFFRTMASIAELERDIIRERTVAGLEAARSRGRKGGRPQVHQKNISIALKMYHSKQYTIKEIEQATQVSRTTLYRYVNNQKYR